MWTICYSKTYRLRPYSEDSQRWYQHHVTPWQWNGCPGKLYKSNQRDGIMCNALQITPRFLIAQRLSPTFWCWLPNKKNRKMSRAQGESRGQGDLNHIFFFTWP